MKKIITTILLLTLTLPTFAGGVGYINYDKVIQNYQYAKNTLTQIETKNNEITLPIQFNGKLKATITISVDEDESSVKEKVHNAIDSKLDGKTIVKEIYVPGRIVNIVAK